MQKLSPEAKKRQLEYITDYNRKTYKTFTVKYRKVEDAEIIAFLRERSKEHGGFNKYFQKFVKEDMKKYLENIK